jgi:hypothetical protein
MEARGRRATSTKARNTGSTVAGKGLLKVDPLPLLTSSSNAAIAFFARRDLQGMRTAPVSTLWDLPEALRIVGRQSDKGSWQYPGGASRAHSREKYDQLETFRQAGTLVEKFGFTRKHPSIENAARFLLSFQTTEGDLRGIYGDQYATTYVGAIIEVLVKAGYADDPRVARAFRWLMSIRQDDGGWAIPVRTVGIPFSEFFELRRRQKATAPDRSKPSSHLVTGMVLRAFAAHPVWRKHPDVRQAGRLLASRLYKRDFYGDRGDVAYWERVSFPFWFTDIVSAMDSLSRLGMSAAIPSIAAALQRLREVQRANGTFELKRLRGKTDELDWWVCLAVCRSLKRFALDARPRPASLKARSSGG